MSQNQNVREKLTAKLNRLFIRSFVQLYGRFFDLIFAFRKETIVELDLPSQSEPSLKAKVEAINEFEAFKEHKGSLNQEKNLKGRFCRVPFEWLGILEDFHGYLCCPSWLPKNHW